MRRHLALLRLTLFSSALVFLGGVTSCSELIDFSATQGNSGRTFVYFADYSGDAVYGFSQNASSGKLSALSGGAVSLPPGTNPFALTFDGLKRYLYVDEDSGNLIHGYVLNPITGGLTPIVGGNPGSSESGICSDPLGRFLYTNRYMQGKVYGYTIDQISGALAPVPGGSFAVGASAHGCVVDSTSQFLYSISETNNNVSAFAIQSNGSLVPLAGSPYAAGTQPFTIAIDPASRFLYVSNNGSANLSIFSINLSSGALTPVLGSPFSSPIGATSAVIQTDASGQYLFYGVSSGGANLMVYQMNLTTGVPTALPGYPLSVTVFGSGLFTPDFHWLYLTGGASIFPFQFQSKNGSLNAGSTQNPSGVSSFAGGVSVHF